MTGEELVKRAREPMTTPIDELAGVRDIIDWPNDEKSEPESARSTPVPASNAAKGLDLPRCVVDHDHEADEGPCVYSVPASNVSKCVACFEPSHDIDHHDHHYHPLDATTYIGEAHPPVPASNVSEGLREAVERYIVAMTRRASGGTTDAEVQAAYAALYDAAAPERLEPTWCVAHKAYDHCEDAILARLSQPVPLAHAAPEGLDVNALYARRERTADAIAVHVGSMRAHDIVDDVIAAYEGTQPDAAEEAGR